MTLSYTAMMARILVHAVQMVQSKRAAMKKQLEWRVAEPGDATHVRELTGTKHYKTSLRCQICRWFL